MGVLEDTERESGLNDVFNETKIENFPTTKKQSRGGAQNSEQSQLKAILTTKYHTQTFFN